jgi:transcriptional regulator with XRE-family HTH domain
MKKHQKPRTETSEAVRALRKELGLTQQGLAGALKTAISTCARWEGGWPPGGRSLLQLAKLADRRGLPDHAKRFRWLYYNEAAMRNLRPALARIFAETKHIALEDTDTFAQENLGAIMDRLIQEKRDIQDLERVKRRHDKRKEPKK